MMKNNSMANQQIFKGMYVEELRDNIRSGESLCDYYKKEVDYTDSESIESSIKVDTESLKLRYKEIGQSASNDLENAIALYEAFPELSETQASDSRLWTYLTHVSLREYVMTRWPLDGSCEQTMQDERQKQATISYIVSHWFATGGNDRTLRRNALARLWWAVRLTLAPWLRDREFFSDLTGDDVYRFTRVLFSTQDIYQQVLERGLGRDNRMLITILEFIEQHPEIKREQIRDFMKELNLALSVSNFSTLNREAMKRAIFEIGEQQLGPK
jgi:hypothetical protein